MHRSNRFSNQTARNSAMRLLVRHGDEEKAVSVDASDEISTILRRSFPKCLGAKLASGDGLEILSPSATIQSSGLRHNSVLKVMDATADGDSVADVSDKFAERKREREARRAARAEQARAEEEEYEEIKARLLAEEAEAEKNGFKGKVLARMRSEPAEKGISEEEYEKVMKAKSARYISGVVIEPAKQDMYRVLNPRDQEVVDNMPEKPPISEILPGVLYLAGLLASVNAPPEGYTHVIIASNQACTPFKASTAYLPINVEDTEEADIGQYFDVCADFIAEAIRDPSSRILVHCRRGMSRSASLVLAYFMKHRSFSLRQAFEEVSRCRGICVNAGFLEQLQDFEVRLKGRNASVQYEEAKERGWVCASFPKAAESEKDAANQDFLRWQQSKRTSSNSTY